MQCVIKINKYTYKQIFLKERTEPSNVNHTLLADTIQGSLRTLCPLKTTLVPS